MALNKEQLQFHLNRILKDVDPGSIDHEALATAGVSYERRQELVKAAGGDPDRAEAIRTCLELVDKYYHA